MANCVEMVCSGFTGAPTDGFEAFMCLERVLRSSISISEVLTSCTCGFADQVIRRRNNSSSDLVIRCPLVEVGSDASRMALNSCTDIFCAGALGFVGSHLGRS